MQTDQAKKVFQIQNIGKVQANVVLVGIDTKTWRYKIKIKINFEKSEKLKEQN